MSHFSRVFATVLVTLGTAAAGAGTADARGPAPHPHEVIVDVDVGEPVMIAGERQRAYIQIAIEGFAPPRGDRPPVNLALVIDRSGSMRGDRLDKAKEAALMVVDHLGPSDILSVVTYDSDVEVLVPPAPLRDPETVRRRIMAISDRGSTALFAGVATGIESVRRHLSKNRVNRVILLSDGIANVGPSSPGELAQLGVRAGSLGVPITTIGLGLGYNEDLMTQLALASDGNHAFAESAGDLHAIFTNELGDVLSVVAQDIIIEIELEPGIRPIRGLGRPVAIRGNKASLKLNNVYGKQKKNVLLEVEVPASRAGSQRKLADVGVRYRNLITKKVKKVSARPTVRFSQSSREVAQRAEREVMVTVVEALANEKQKAAIALRDKGDVAGARAKLKEASGYLRQNGRRYRSEKLDSFAEETAAASESVASDRDWSRGRKQMKKSVHSKAAQQSW